MTRVSGLISIAVNGTRLNVVGSWDYNLGEPMRETLVGHDRVHGYKELPQVPFLEGEIRHTGDLDLRALVRLRDATITLDLPNGKAFVLRDAHAAGEWTTSTEEGNTRARFEGMSADITKPV